MPCNSELISRSIDGDLSEEEQRQLDDHLRGCAPCRKELVAMARIDREVRAVVQAAGARTPDN